MELSVFTDKSNQPDDNRLSQVLGGKGKFWKAIKKHIREKYGDVTEEWKFYSPKYGSTLKTMLKKRNLF